VGHSISRKSHALSSSCNIDHFVVQLILRLRQAGKEDMGLPGKGQSGALSCLRAERLPQNMEAK
jgi:hypothetical protein